MRTRIMGCLKCISLLLLLAFIGPGKSLLFHSDIDGSKDSLLLHSSNEPSTSAPIGPLGLETTVSILAMEITRLQADMKARDDKMKNQEVEILHLKTLLGESNATTSLLSNRVLDELHTLNSTVTEIKTDLDIINSAAGIQAILLKLNSMAQSIRYLTLSLTEQATMLDATNNSLQQDILNLKRELGTYASDIAVLKYNESSNFVNLQSQINGVKYSVNSLQTKTSSLQSHINSLESTSRSQQSSISMLQSKSAELSSSVTSLTSKLVDYFRHFVMDGFANGHLTSALHYSDIRLVGGGSNSGRVEISVNGVWGTVCDDSFDSNNNAAKVVCRSLGKPWHYAEHRSSGVYGRGDESTLILLDGVQCNGNEGSIAACSHGDYGRHDCSHSEDVGVICQ